MIVGRVRAAAERRPPPAKQAILVLSLIIRLPHPTFQRRDADAREKRSIILLNGCELAVPARRPCVELKTALAFSARVIPGARASNRIAGRIHRDANLPEAAVERLVGRRVAENVLVADLMCDLARDGIHLRQILGIPGLPARRKRERIQGALGVLGLAGFISAQQADAV